MSKCLKGSILAAISGILMLSSLFSGTPRASAYTATVSSTNMQTVKGWGVHAFDTPQASQVTQAFCVDLHMNVARIALWHDQGLDETGDVNGPNMDPTCNGISTFNSYGIPYILCSWSPNINMKNPATIYGAPLNTYDEGNFANYWVNLLNYIKGKGLPLPIGICLQNEPTTDPQTYDGMEFAGQSNFDFSQYYRIVKDLRNKLNSNGYNNVKILGPEDGCYDTGNNWGDSMAFLGGNGFPVFSSDSTLASAIGACSSHSYNWGGGVGYLQQWASSCEQWGKDKWMTEYSYIENGENGTPLIDTAVMGTRRLVSDMACVRNNYWMWWDGYNPGIPTNEVLISDDGTYTKYPLFYVLQKIFTNAPPGSIARRVTSTDPNMHVADDIWMDGVAFVNGNSTTTVLVNSSTTTASSTSLSGLTGTTASVYQTTSSQNMALVSSPAVSGGTISNINLPAWSVTVVVTTGSPNTSGPAKVNAGGPAASPFVADADFTGGTTATNWTGTITTTGVTNPAPQAVYQSERYGSPAMSYAFGGLTPSTNYTVRLHFCENFFTASGQRTFTVAINGTNVLTNFDIFATSGAIHKANVQQFTATANGSGQIVIAFTNITNNALINGIEVNAAIPPVPTGLTASAGNGQALLSWNASTGATSYNVKRSTVSGSGYATVASPTTNSYVNTGLTNGTTYYFVVSAVNAGGESGNSGQASASPAAAPQAQIANAAIAPVIDGNNTDSVWTTATSYSINNIGGTISSGADLTGSYKAAWDTTNLYLLVDVTDDVKVNDSTNPWDDDAVELFLDADHNGGTVYDANDRQYVFGWNDTAVVEAGGRSATGVTFAKVDPTGTTYRIEAKVPWSTLAFTAAANAIIGIDVQVDDDDDGGARDGYRTWNDTTGQGWTNPSVFGTGKLLASTGSLTGSVANTPASVNLTSEGTIDWAHWGLGGVVPGYDHKSSGGTKISTYIATGTVGAFNVTTGQTFTYNWTDGTPDASISNSESGVSVPVVGNNFVITAPADTTQKILKVYCGGWQSRGQITAHLSDGSAVDYVDSSQTAGLNASFNVVYTLTYKAASAGQTLKVTWMENTDNSGNGGGNSSLQAATLH